MYWRSGTKIDWPQLRSSLALRLVALFCAGSAVIMAATGYTLYHALKIEVEERDNAEMSGKTEVIAHLLREIAAPANLATNLERFRDIPVGHPHLSIGVFAGGEWLVRPREEIAVAALDAVNDQKPGAEIARLRLADAAWWLRWIHHEWPSERASIDVLLAVDVSESQRLLKAHATAAWVVAVLGTVVSAVLAWFVARRGLAPLAYLAARAEQVTAHRLGTALAVEDAPAEVRGLVESINHMLARLNQSFQTLEQFSADIAHELRTPINNLLMQTQVTLSRPREAHEYRETLLSNLEELQRLHRMVSDMLFLARAERGMLTLTVEPVDIAREAANVAEYFEAAASEKSQRMVIKGEGIAHGDRLMIRRALTNLLSNAVRYSPPGQTINIEIATTPNGCLVQVSNPCAPIDTRDLARFFARFARGHQAPAEKSEGAGLGLAIVDSIMRLHGGAAKAESGDFGIRLTLSFPRNGTGLVTSAQS